MPRRKQNLTSKINQAIMDKKETKFTITGFSQVNVGTPTVGAFTHLMSNVAQGTSETQRVGTNIIGRSYYMSFLLTADQTLGAGQYNLCRLLIYHKKDANGGSMDGLLYNQQPDQDQFVIHYDSGIVGLTGQAPIWKKTVAKKFYNKRSSGMTLTYTGASATSGVERPLYIYCVSNSAVNLPQIDVTGKFYFKD